MVPFWPQWEDTEHRQLWVNAHIILKVVAVMPEAVKAQSRSQVSRLTLNSDGQAHPVLNLLTVLTLVLGIAAFVCGLIVRAHFLATVLGIAGFAIGLGAQLNSATREERIFIITGVIAAFVGMALGIGHGGFS